VGSALQLAGVKFIVSLPEDEWIIAIVPMKVR